MSNVYGDCGEAAELAIDRSIPDKAVVMVKLQGVPEIKEVGANKTPVAEAQYVIEGGQFDGRKVRRQLWLGTVPKEGKEKPAIFYSKIALAEAFLMSIGCPKPEFVQGKETPASQAKRAPFVAKWTQLLQGVTDAKGLLTKTCQPLVGKTMPARLRVSENNGFKSTEVQAFLTPEEFKTATEQKAA